MRNHGILAIAFVIGVASAFPALALPAVPRDLKAVRVDLLQSVPASGTIGFNVSSEEHKTAARGDEELYETAGAMCRQAVESYGEFEGPDVCVYD